MKAKEMHQAQFRFYAELNDFLPGHKRNVEFPYTFTGNPAVKDAIESIGVPHIEVDLILVNSKSVDFMYRIKDQDKISVYPVFEILDISEVQRLRAEPLRDTKFILDVHLGRLAKYMRLCGLDTYYEKDLSDREIIDLSLSGKRAILTRDRGLLKAKEVTHGHWIRTSMPTEQLKEVIQSFDLKNSFHPFSRCLECNGVLVEVGKEKIEDLLPARTREYYKTFRQCPVCKRVYWEGSHFERMKKFLENNIETSV